jgi:hypothetical protein
MTCPRLSLVGVAASVAVLACPGFSGARQARVAHALCVNVSHGIPRGDKIIASGTHAHVAPGAIVFVVLVEPAAYTGLGYPGVFPWLTSSSSNPRVLRPVPICSEKNLPASTLPVREAAFRAERPGRAFLSAPLERAWREAPRNPFRAHRAVVLVATRY